MKLLADANVEMQLVAWLRAAGHDVVWAAELKPGLEDAELLGIASREERVMLTHDLDFGELVFRNRLSAYSVVLMRFAPPDQTSRLALLTLFWTAVEEALKEPVFIVVTEQELRIRPLPPAVNP